MRYDATIQVPVPADLKARVRDAAKLDDRTAASFARVALARYCQTVEADARTREASRRAAIEHSWDAAVDEAARRVDGFDPPADSGAST
jgi:hypothetical protein